MTSARQIFVGTRRGPALPYDAEVEYIESTGTQWIDTGVVGTQDTTLSIEWLKTQDVVRQPSQSLIGAADGVWDHTPVSMSMWQYGSFGFGNNSNKDWGVFRYVSNTRYVSSLSKDGFYVNGSLVVVPHNSLTKFSTVYTVSIFSFNLGGGLHEPGILRCYGATIKSGDVLVRDFIPVRFTNEQGVSEGAMYDRVSGQLFRNVGTGAFKFGTDIAGGGYKWLGYSPLRFSRSTRLWKEAA